MTISRRDLLKYAAVSAPLLGAPGLRQLAFAADGADRGLLVVVHLRGGCDGLNLISPATDPTFIEARVSDLRVQADGPDAGHRLDHSPDPKVDFRLHTAANGLADLYGQGRLAFVHAAGLTDEQRSHFVAIDMMEHGVAGQASLSHSNTGWLSRYLQTIGVTAPTSGIAASGGITSEFLGDAGGLAIPDLGGGFGAPGGPQVNAVLAKLYSGVPGPVAAAGRATLQAMTTIDARIPRDAQNKPAPYIPENGANYDPGGDLGRALRVVAQLAKMQIGLQVATADIGGWDTHENQPGRFRNCVDRLNAGISAFYADMGRFHDRLILVTFSEFGRRLRSNRSNGTDHGRAGVMMVLGAGVQGGRFYGRWPGLTTDKLDEGVDLSVTTDYRQVLTEVLAAHSGRGPGITSVFPDYAAAKQPLGIFAAATAAARPG